MNGTTAQLVALTIHGNSILQDKYEPESLEKRTKAFVHCEYVRFVEKADASARKELIWSASPEEWMKKLRQEGIHAIHLCYWPSGRQDAPDRMLAGFVGGGGRWALETRGLQVSDYWIPRWIAGDRERKDRKIWQVSYLRIANQKRAFDGSPEDLSKLKTEMTQCLRNIAQFSRAQHLEPFTRLFESALNRLESPTPLEGLYVEDIAPPDSLRLPAAQLLGAAADASVFGGMGSWNDQGFEGEAQKEYERVSEYLFQLLNRVIVAAANSSSLSP